MPKFESGGMPSCLSDQYRSVRSWPRAEVCPGGRRVGFWE